MTVDLTLVVTAHDESAVCGPTMTSADRAVAAAREAGVTVQPIIALDAPTEATRAYFHQSRFDQWERRVVDERDQGRGRTALIPETEGRYVAFLHAGDLLSRNWLIDGVRRLEAAKEQGERAIAHPELTVVFDGECQVVLNVDQRSPLFAPHYLYFGDFYDGSALTPREVFETADLGPDARPGEAGDPRFTIETAAAGWRHMVVPDTIVFRRRTELPTSGGHEDTGPSTPPIPAMEIDRIRQLPSS